MVFAHPAWLFLLPAVLVPWLFFRGKSYVGHSDVGRMEKRTRGGYLHLFPLVSLSLGFVALLFALATPQHPFTEPQETIKARDIMIAVDKSGSMSTEFDGEVPTPQAGNSELDKELPPLPKSPALGDTYGTDDGSQPQQRRIDAAQASVLNFVRDRFMSKSGDRVGVLVFDQSPYISWPLTSDLKMIYRKLQLTTHGVGGGTNFGEYKPGPIDAAVAQFDELGQSSTRVLIMVTDGEDNLSDDAQDRLLKLLQSRHIRLYVIGVGPTLAENDVDIIKLAQKAGGQVFRVENGGDLNLCFQTINSLEQSAVQVSGAHKHDERFYYFAYAALFFFLVGLTAEAIVLNQ
ncbi:MAG TPA: VWA domain-containing protein [Planktothrix sp.]|jgi:Mg-chelatase subunit ChlD